MGQVMMVTLRENKVPRDSLLNSLEPIVNESSVVRECWGRRTVPFTASADFAQKLQGIDLQWLLGSGMLRVPYLTIRREGKEVSIEEYTESRSVGKSKFAGYVVEPKVRDLILDGCTLLFSYTEQWVAGVGDACRSLKAGLQARGGATLFYTPAHHRGLEPHRDASHVLVFQLLGKKRWVVEREAPSNPDCSSPISEQEFHNLRNDLDTFRLSEGMGLYMPTGVAHVASSEDEASLHLSIYVSEPKASDLIYAAAIRIASAFPVNAPTPAPGPERVQWAESVMAESARRLVSLDARELVQGVAKRVAQADY